MKRGCGGCNPLEGIGCYSTEMACINFKNSVFYITTSFFWLPDMVQERIQQGWAILKMFNAIIGTRGNAIIAAKLEQNLPKEYGIIQHVCVATYHQKIQFSQASSDNCWCVTMYLCNQSYGTVQSKIFVALNFRESFKIGFSRFIFHKLDKLSQSRNIEEQQIHNYM